MSEMIIYENNNGDIKIDVTFEDENIWLSQAQLCEVFDKAKATISEHITNIFQEQELDENSTVRKFRTVQMEENREVSRDIEFYKLDDIVTLNGKELLTHYGKISHTLAVKKSELEYQKYEKEKQEREKQESLKELEDDIKRLQ